MGQTEAIYPRLKTRTFWTKFISLTHTNLQYTIRHVCMIFPQKIYSSEKQYFSPISGEKTTLVETIHYIPKFLRKGNPFHGPSAQLSNAHTDLEYKGHACNHLCSTGYAFSCQFDCLSFQRWATPGSITRQPAAIETRSQIAADICLEIF